MDDRFGRGWRRRKWRGGKGQRAIAADGIPAVAGEIFHGRSRLGTRAFVNEMFNVFRERFGGKRKDGARRMRYVNQEEMYCLRNLQVRIIGP